MTTSTVPTRRKKVDPAEASARAREIVPDPSALPDAPEEEGPAERSAARAEPDEEPSTRVDAGDAAPGPWGAIIDSVIQVEPRTLFTRLRAELGLGEPGDVMSYQVVALALEAADRNYFDAILLTRSAKLQEQREERGIEERMEVLRTSARAALEKEKREAIAASGSKAVGKATLEEVRDRCRSSWPDAVSNLERRRDEAHAARAVCEELATAWRSRASSLRELIQGLRAAR